MKRRIGGHSVEHIAIDLDDVILDFVGGIVRWMWMEYGVVIDEKDIVDFNLRPVLDPLIGKNWWTAFRERDWLWPNFEAVPGAIGAMERLRAESRYLEIVTSKPRWAEYATWKWLGKWRPPAQRVTIVGPDDSKVDFSDAQLLIDDKPQNLTEWVARRTPTNPRLGIMFDRPHNRKVNILGVPRAKNWAEVLAIIQQMDEET